MNAQKIGNLIYKNNLILVQAAFTPIIHKDVKLVKIIIFYILANK